MIKTRCLVVFRLAQSWFIYVKLEKADAEINYASRPGSIDRNFGSINRKSSQMRFLQNSNSALICFKMLEFFNLSQVYKANPSHV